jgi:hypothetical protein
MTNHCRRIVSITLFGGQRERLFTGFTDLLPVYGLLLIRR